MPRNNWLLRPCEGEETRGLPFGVRVIDWLGGLLRCAPYQWASFPLHRSGSRRAPPPHLRSTPPSRDALRHSGGERRRCTSATVTLYLEVELSSDKRPGTEQKTSLGFTTPPKSASLLMGMEETALALDLERDTGPAEARGRGGGRAALVVHQS